MATEQQCANFWINKLSEGVSPTSTDAKSKEAQSEYQQKCGLYDKDLIECIRLDNQMQGQISSYANQSVLISESSSALNVFLPSGIATTQKKFAQLGCIQKLEKYRQAELGKVAEKFTGLDKARIEAQSIYERNQRVFFGALILLGGITLITFFGKNK